MYDRRLERIENKIDRILIYLNFIANAEINMASVGQDILDKVTAEDTLIDSVLALLQGFVNNGTITPDVLTAINSKIQGSEDKLNAALAANTTPPANP